MLFYFSDYSDFPAIASLSIVCILIIVASPIVVPYLVFGNSNKKEWIFKILRESSKWLGLVCVANLIIYFCFIKYNVVIGNPEQMFLTIIFSAALTFIFGVIALPHWQGFLAVFFYIGYCVYFFTL